MTDRGGRRRVDPRVDAAWADLAASHGSLFNSPPWIKTITDAFEISISAEIDTARSGQRTAVAWADLDDPGGCRRSMFPFCDYFDPMTDGAGPGWDTIGRMLDIEGSAVTMRVRDQGLPASSGLLSATGRFAWHGVELTSTTGEHWSALPSKARQSIRRAERLGTVVEVERGVAALEEFRRLHVALRREKYRMLAQPPEFFEALASNFDERDLVVVSARNADGKMIAGITLIRWKSTAYYKFNASSSEGVAAHANDLCMWRAIQHARESWGAQTLDLGLSDFDQPGLLRYKRKYATDEGELVNMANEEGRRLPQRARFFEVLNAIVSVVVEDDVPEDVGVRASSRIYRHFC